MYVTTSHVHVQKCTKSFSPFGSFLDLHLDKYMNAKVLSVYVNWTNKETQNRLRRGSNVDAILGSH